MCSGHINKQAPVKSKDPSWFPTRNILLFLSSLCQTQGSEAIFTTGKLLNSSDHPDICLKATSQKVFMQVQLLLHGPAQVSLHEPGVNDRFAHSFPFRIYFTGSNEIYRGFEFQKARNGEGWGTQTSLNKRRKDMVELTS